MKARSLFLPILLALIMVVPWSGGLGSPRVAAAAFDTADETFESAVDEGTPGGESDGPSDVEGDPTGQEDPSATPTEAPTETPTETPSETPTAEPTEDPVVSPTETPTETPVDEPTATPDASPTETPDGTPVEDEPAVIAAAQDDIVVTLNCRGNPEMTRIDNNGNGTLEIKSIAAQLDGTEYPLDRKLGPGRTVIFRSGSGATSGTILTTNFLYDDDAYANDGVVIETNTFDIEAQCPGAPAPPASSIKVTLNCTSDPETTRIDNQGSTPLVIYSVGSIDAPAPGEPYTVNRTLGAGKTVIYRSGGGATSGTILTTTYLYGNSAYDADGVRLSTNAGTIEKRCAAKVHPSQLSVTVSCHTSPETITIKNVGQGPVRLSSIRTSYEPIAAEPFGLNTTLNPNQTITYQSGAGASANVLTSQHILNQNVGTQERVTVTVSTGKTFSRSCPAIPTGERWIDINLTTQYLTAYQGNTAVNGYYISSGRYPNFETPTGTFYINTKYVSQTMAGCLQGECYHVPNVPHVMYFTHVGHAIHGAYWHNNFGRRMSHGCINEPLAQAEWLFNWASIGTKVVIHY